MEKINFIPGPATIDKGTLNQAANTPMSHRTEEFASVYNNSAAKLHTLTKAKHITFMAGSGTLANDVIGAQISLLNGQGLIITNGEFGERLVDQARRFALKFEQLSYDWGKPFDYNQVLSDLNGKTWAWFVHCETSTGILNDLNKISAYCKEKNIKLCVDAISSIGNTETDFSNVYLASATSGKGLAALPGIAIVFSSYKAPSNASLPKYLDLGFYHLKDGLPFTLSANLLGVLNYELSKDNISDNISYRNRLGGILLKFAERNNFRMLGDKNSQASFIFTFQLPQTVNSAALGSFLKGKGIDIHYKNPYLIERNWIQISLMGYTSLKDVLKLKSAISEFIKTNTGE